MNVASKVDAILNAWLDYVALDDYSKAGIEIGKNPLKLHGISLKGNDIFIEQSTFLELSRTVTTKKQSQEDEIWVLSFPSIRTQEDGKSYLRPLFSLDVTSVLQGKHQPQGWSIDNLNLIEAGENLAKFLKLDDEEREQLNTQHGLRNLLNSTFGLDLETTYEDWMKSVSVPYSHQIKEIKPQPYLFEFKGSGYSANLRRDLKEIKSGSKNCSKGHPGFEYLFGEPKPAKQEVIYIGAFPTPHPPTNSQSTALKHAQSEPITAVQGPPGSGKTTLILHVIAQQVVKRALSLIEIGQDINNLTVVSSTNNKAVDNVIEKLDEFLKNDLFYLKGGNKDNIGSANGASAKLRQAIDFLQKNQFDEQLNNLLKRKIQQIKEELLAEESRYLKLSQQWDLDKQRHKHLSQQIQRLQQNLDEILSTLIPFQQRARDLSQYNQLPIQAYNIIEKHFNKAESLLSESRLNWWVRFWRWLTGKTEERILRELNSACKSAIEQTSTTIFPIEPPTNRADLIQKAGLVRERINEAGELKNVQKRLEEKYKDRDQINQQMEDALKEFQLLEISLANPPENFYTSFHQKFHDKQKDLFKLSREFLIQQALYNKYNIKPTLEIYCSLISGDWKSKYKIAENLDEHIKNLSLIFPVITCTLLSIRKMIPWIEECVDRTIIDEAGMIDQHKAFPLLVRSRKAIIVGDPLQIEPIITLSNQRREDYRQTAFINRGLTDIDYHRYSPEEEYSATAYHRAAGATGEGEDKGKGIILREHYRCQPSIIQYCNAIADYDLEIKTEPVNSLVESHLIAYDVEGNIRNNVNEEEVTAVCEIIEHLVKQGYSVEDIGVISPFKFHAAALREQLREKFSQLDSKSVGTVHTFQGSEKKVIILSTKVCQPQDNVYWINKRPNLLNVAVSRAKELFILVGNLYRLEKGNLTRQLVEHIREYGVVLEYKSAAEIPKAEPGTTPVYDCAHLRIFREAIDQAEEELIIVTPWIRGSESKLFGKEVVSVLERRVKVTVVYGNKGNEENDNNDPTIENKLRHLFSQYPGSQLIRLGEGKHIESRGTNERILVRDTKLAIIGTWNWLSHPYRTQCGRTSLNIKPQIRQETSVQFSDLSSIESIKAKIYQLISQ
ncbi:AAA domain-containing protein [Nostoc sp. UHCC 0870]|uniref:AAA domain-containing protein n=1 Tax=Nostoc sp. UHCC 0870 TaxID=2914041 RepID=UPI001EDD9D2D|nr:AAA domain-containing protein [Nostoc sp. UHCC 0870]UKO99987.1 AAA domain-containing protein [Nostoc sp. UHCC 0870]